MCRMLGMTSNYDTYLNFSYDILSGVLRKLCNEHKVCHGHGVGFAWYQDGKWHIKKESNPLWMSPTMKQLVNYTRSRAMVVHARQSTYPDYAPQGIKPENAHPFLIEYMGFRWIFAHNGEITFNPSLVKVRPSDRILEYKGNSYPLSSYGIDSEVFFRIFIHELNEYGGEEPRNVISVLDHVLSSGVIARYHSLNFILGTHRYLYALRLFNEEVENAESRYTLYYMLRKGSSLAGQLLKKKPNELNFFVSSEPITANKWLEVVHVTRPGFPEEDWKPLENGEFIYVPIGRPAEFQKEKIS